MTTIYSQIVSKSSGKNNIFAPMLSDYSSKSQAKDDIDAEICLYSCSINTNTVGAFRETPWDAVRPVPTNLVKDIL
jgi:hypothetical protein